MRVCPGCETQTPDDEARDFCPACGAPFPLPLRDDASAAETQLAPSLIPALIGSTVDGFLFEAIVGGGSFGTVFRGRQIELDRVVALKVPTHEIAADPIMAKRFAREARAAARVSHPGVVTIYQVGELPDGRPYLAMQLVEGEPLDKILKGGPVKPGRALAIARLVASALAETHAADVVHRDLKPSNIMWRRDRTGDDRITLVDFGIAVCKPGSGPDATSLTSGGLIGTPHYMSPEQSQGELVDARSDLYALGCVLYELLTGTPPFTGTAGVDVLLEHVNKAPPPLTGMPPRLDAFVRKLLAKKPGDRPQSAAEVVAMIDELELADPASSPTIPRAQRQPRPPSRKVAVAIAVLALSATGFAAVVLSRTPAPAAIAETEDEPADSPNDPTKPEGAGRRQIVGDDGELTMRAVLPDPIRANVRIGVHIEIWNKLGQPIDAPDLVVTVEDPHNTATGLSARGHGAKDARHFSLHHAFPEPGHYMVRIFPPGTSSMFQLDLDVF